LLAGTDYVALSALFVHGSFFLYPKLETGFRKAKFPGNRQLSCLLINNGKGPAVALTRGLALSYSTS